MNIRLLARIVGFASIITVSLSSSLAWAQLPASWTPVLAPAQSGVYGPNDQIILNIGRISEANRKTLTLEFDDMDVNALVSVQNGQIIFTPAQPLEWGEHQLRLVEYAANGDILERGVWTIEVKKTAAFREASLNSNVELIYSNRVNDKGLGEPAPKKDNVAGSIGLQGAVADSDWRINGMADFFYNSDETQTARGDQFDLGNFLVSGDKGPVSAAAGHQTLSPNNLIMRGFSRRGAAVKYKSGFGNSNVTGFVMSTSNIYGFQQGLGISNPKNRVQGFTFSSQPIQNQNSSFSVEATYIDGEGQDRVGEGIGGDPSATEGSAADIVLDGQILGRRLRLRGEVARTSYDFDGANTGFDPENDNAYSLLAVYTPWQNKIVKNSPMALQFGLENRRIGTFFRSQANPNDVSDRDVVRGTVNFSWSGFSSDLALGREQDNVNNLSTLASTETSLTSLLMSYSPGTDSAPSEFQGDRKRKLLGQPTYGLNWQRSDRSLDCTACAIGQSLQDTRNLELSAAFVYDTWDWSVAHSVGEIEDSTGLQPDSEDDTTQLATNIRIGQNFNLASYVQWLNTRNDAIKQEGNGRAVGLNLSHTFTDKINGSIGYNLNVDDQPGDAALFIDPVILETTDITASVAWTLWYASEWKPGLTLSLDGQSQEVIDKVFNSEQIAYQVFLKVAVSWTPGI